MSLFTLSDQFSATPKEWKKIIWSSRCKMLCWIFLKKWFKKPNIIEARQTLNNLGVAISRHITFFPFLPISGHFWTTQKNQRWSIRSRKVSYNWGHFFFDYLKRKSFYSRSKKNTYFVLIAGEPISAAISIALVWWSRRCIYLFSFILLQFCYW